MVRVLFITPYYPPEISAPAVRISETAIRLVKRGYQVTVLTTFPNFPYGVVPPEYRGHVIQREEHDGILQLYEHRDLVSELGSKGRASVHSLESSTQLHPGLLEGD